MAQILEQETAWPFAADTEMPHCCNTIRLSVMNLTQLKSAEKIAKAGKGAEEK